MKKAFVLIFALLLCAVSCAFAEESDLPVFANFGEAKELTAPCQGILGRRSTTVAKVDGKLYHVAAVMDEETYELYNTFLQLNEEKEKGDDTDLQAVHDTLMEHVNALPVTEVYEITDVPMTDEEMNALIGKPLKEVCEYCEGMSFYLSPDSLQECEEVTFTLYRSPFLYKATVDEPWKEFSKLEKDEYYDNLTVRKIEYLYPYAT